MSAPSQPPVVTEPDWLQLWQQWWPGLLLLLLFWLLLTHGWAVLRRRWEQKRLDEQEYQRAKARRRAEARLDAEQQVRRPGWWQR